MSRIVSRLLGLLIPLMLPSLAMSETAKVGHPAPDFTVRDARGAEVSLKSFAGKTVVLEWFNPGCPFVKKFYTGGDMQRLQRESIAKGVVWLTINSSAEGKPGHLSSAEAVDIMGELSLASTALLLDGDGRVGKLYGARVTPHMFVINPQGSLAYAGAIDSVASTRSGDISAATNYVVAALDAITAGKQPSPNDTEPYGCSVKYAS